MQDLINFGASANRNMSTPARHVDRTISRHRASGQVRIAQVETETDVVLAEMDALTDATGYGMNNVFRVFRLHQHLEQLAPDASGRLAMLADIHALGMATSVDGLQRRLRR